MKKTLLVLLLSLTAGTWAKGVKIEGVNFSDQGKQGQITINLEKELEDFPELSVKGNYVQVAIPGSYVWPKIEKQFSLNNRFDSKIMAYQFNKDLVRVRAVLPDNVESKSNKVSLSLKGNSIVVSFPHVEGAHKTASVGRSPAVVGAAQDVKVVDKYDESYLDKLLKQKEESIKVKKEMKPAAKVQATTSEAKAPAGAQDQVKMALSGTKKSSSNLSLMSYAGKFAGFLALVLLLFYAAVSLFKKGAFKKGKLGFLNSTKIVEVLNTTYIGPKRSLLLIRAHNQVFLVGSSEKGLHMISEVNDVNGLFKQGEKEVSGSNFDTNLSTAQEKDPTFKLKEFLNQENLEEINADDEQENFALSAVTKEEKTEPKSAKVKFSQQIKNKVKDLKPLQ